MVKAAAAPFGLHSPHPPHRGAAPHGLHPTRQSEASARIDAAGGLDPAASARRRALAEVLARQRAMGLAKAAGTADLELDDGGRGSGGGSGGGGGGYGSGGGYGGR
jgi:hypothetical protein